MCNAHGPGPLVLTIGMPSSACSEMKHFICIWWSLKTMPPCVDKIQFWPGAQHQFSINWPSMEHRKPEFTECTYREFNWWLDFWHFDSPWQPYDDGDVYGVGPLLLLLSCTHFMISMIKQRQLTILKGTAHTNGIARNYYLFFYVLFSAHSQTPNTLKVELRTMEKLWMWLDLLWFECFILLFFF